MQHLNYIKSLKNCCY